MFKNIKPVGDNRNAGLRRLHRRKAKCLRSARENETVERRQEQADSLWRDFAHKINPPSQAFRIDDGLKPGLVFALSGEPQTPIGTIGKHVDRKVDLLHRMQARRAAEYD